MPKHQSAPPGRLYRCSDRLRQPGLGYAGAGRQLARSGSCHSGDISAATIDPATPPAAPAVEAVPAVDPAPAVEAAPADEIAPAPEAAIAEEPAEEPYEPIGEGEASYYGYELAGNRTASGERFNPKALTAAHRTLPLGTKLRVINKSNGKSVIVRINDRGPFVKKRLIDISLGAAQQINMVRAGKAMVRLERLR